MKPFRLILIMVLAVAALAPAGARGEETFAFVNMERVFSEYSKTKTAEGRLKQQAQLFREETEGRMEELKALEEAFSLARQEAQDMALSEEVRKQRRTEAEEKLVEMREKENEVRAFTEERRRELESTSRRLREGIVIEITKVLNEIAKQKDFVAVFDSSGNSFNQVPVILYRRPALDITDAVLEKLNAAAPAEVTEPAPAAETKE